MNQRLFNITREILEKTHDGNDLTPDHLKLVELGINEMLSLKGERALYELLYSVRIGYKKPWFHDKENLTQDLEGFIYWKGKQIEHYSFSDFNEEKKAAQQLAKACRIAEQRNVEVTFDNVYEIMHSGGPKLKKQINQDLLDQLKKYSPRWAAVLEKYGTNLPRRYVKDYDSNPPDSVLFGVELNIQYSNACIVGEFNSKDNNKLGYCCETCNNLAYSLDKAIRFHKNQFEQKLAEFIIHVENCHNEDELI